MSSSPSPSSKMEREAMEERKKEERPKRARGAPMAMEGWVGKVRVEVLREEK